MKAVIQRCKSASVTVDGKVISSIGRGKLAQFSLSPFRELIDGFFSIGILCLIGVGTHDTDYEAKWLSSKLLAMRLFPEDKNGEEWGWKYSVQDAEYEVLCGKLHSNVVSETGLIPPRE